MWRDITYSTLLLGKRPLPYSPIVLRIREEGAFSRAFYFTFNGSIHDIKVQGKRRAPDDTLYNKYADLR